MVIKEEDLKLVYWTMNKFFPRYVGDEDIFQTMCLALAEAQDQYEGSVKDNQTHLVNRMRWAVLHMWRGGKKHNPEGIVPISLESALEADNGGHGNGIDRYASMTAPEYYPWSIELPAWMDEKEKGITTMLAQGYSQREIGESLGVSRQHVSDVKRKLQKELLQRGYLTQEEADDRKKHCKRSFRIGNK